MYFLFANGINEMKFWYFWMCPNTL